MKTKKIKSDKINVITLGCSKNLVDSENLITQLRHHDWEVAHDSSDDDANIIIVNTCGFIDVAKEESVNTILEYAAVKSAGGIEKLFVTGCLSQRYRDDLQQEIPEVDAWFGTMDMPALLARFNADYRHELIGERQIMTPPHYAYLKISEGCNRTCSFCAIPLMRGDHVSRPIEAIVTEAATLASRGVKELMLIAQELTYYGLDLYKKRALPELLYALNEVEGLEWIRLHYAYPSKFPEAVLDAMRDCDKVCKYLDMPLQHINDAVLKSMRRQITRAETESLLHKIRTKMPDIALRTTFLVGYPGETAEAFAELCEFVQQQRFDRVGVFQYSHEEQTAAYAMEDDVPEAVKQARANRLMEIQQMISAEKNREKTGQTLRVLIDHKEGGYFVGRTASDSPEVDNEVLIDATRFFVRIGDFAKVRIIDSTEYDLYGEPIAQN